MGTVCLYWFTDAGGHPRLCSWPEEHPCPLRMQTCLGFPKMKLCIIWEPRSWNHCCRDGWYYLFRDALSAGDFFVNMNCLVLSLGGGFLFHAIETLLLAYYAFLSLVSSQGHFPKLENVGAFKNVSIVPTQATCGLPDRSTFCHSSIAIESIQSCTQRFCIQECPYRSSPASYTALFSTGLGTCITEDKNDLHPGSSINSLSFIFRNHKDCFSTPRSQRLTASFTLTVWLKPEQEGVM